MTLEHDKLKVENDFYLKQNKDFEIENEQLNKEIQTTI